MRLVLLLLSLLSLSPTVSAQTLVPLTTPDGRVACTQGKTGIGRPPVWKSVPDPDGPDGWALAETESDATDQRFTFCVVEQAVTRDMDATLRFKPISGTRDQAAGFIFRAQDASDYYLVRANARDDTVRLYRMDKGKRAQLASKEAPIALGQWHSLRIVAVGDRIDVSLDGKLLFSATDRSLPRAGAMGVWSQADSVTHFGSILVSPPTR